MGRWENGRGEETRKEDGRDGKERILRVCSHLMLEILKNTPILKPAHGVTQRCAYKQQCVYV